ncbi:MAG TPA: MBL fold metallo-hydrolase [Candidatus Saccharimonadales bacterium]|nr:MBL fold metallo-hydrolase [Candidatus Saccharimonadales bacterium]
MQVRPGVFRFADTVNVYLLARDGLGLLIDFGSGDVLDHLSEFGVEHVTDLLLTHHHRDVVQGLARARDAGIRIWAPPTEADLIADIDLHWQARPLDNVYDLREDRFSLLESVPIDGVVAEYRTQRYGPFDVLTLPTPGHTAGSVSYVIDVDDARLAFTGDLITAPGKVWSLAATQWTYTGIEGLGSTILSGLDLLDHRPDRLLPAHGDPIEAPRSAVELLNGRLQELIDLRSPEWRPADLRAVPYLEISPHLLRNRTSTSNSYVLRSDSGAALLIDFGYDFTTGLPGGTDRSSRRPWLQTIPALKREYGIDRIEVAIPTHYHDDHVAGFNLLRAVEGAEVWAPANMVPMLEDPWRFDLPCLWYDPIPVDRTLSFGQTVSWREYEITVHELPGHTLFAAAIEFEVDGRRVLATGDQQDGRWVADERPEFLNYQYRNGFRFDDFRESAELYRRLAPDLLISGHWLPRPVTEGYLDHLLFTGTELARLHRELLPLDVVDLGAGGFAATIEPYRSEIPAGSDIELTVVVRNPYRRVERASIVLVAPTGWLVTPRDRSLDLEPSAEARVTFVVRPTADPVRRARVAADVTVGETRFGQQAEALVTVR